MAELTLPASPQPVGGWPSEEMVDDLASALVAEAFVADIHNLDTGHLEVPKLHAVFVEKIRAVLQLFPSGTPLSTKQDDSAASKDGGE